MGTGAADIAEIVSDVRDRLPGLPRPPHIDDPESARFRLFDSITTFLKAASQRQPLVMVLDDLHWSDQPSLSLMQFLVRELTGARMLLVGTYRDVELNRRHPLAEALGNLTRERLFNRVLLRGLNHTDVERFIEVTSGLTPPASLVDAVHTQTEGNPLFVTEIVRLLVQEGELSPDSSLVHRESWTVRIPEGIREVIGRRLNQLSARCNEVLTVASVVGLEFELRQMDRLVDDLTEDMLLDVLEEGLDARVIEEMPTTIGRYQFTHALIQETLAEELSLTRRVRLHARIAETLEEMYQADIERHASELALHFAQAEAALGSEKMALYSKLAGAQALTAYAHEDALVHFQQALSGKAGQPMDSETADILFGLGQAENMMLRVDEALEHLHAAFDYYEESGDSSRAAAVASVVTTGGALSDGIAPLRVRALALVSPESIEAGWLQALRGRDLGVRFGDYDGAQVAFDRAIAIAERHGDARLRLRILTSASGVDSFFRRIESAISTALDAIDLLQSIESPWDESFARMNLTFSLTVDGRSTEAKMNGEVALKAAEKLGDIDRLATVCDANALAFMAEGDWERAREFSDRGLSASPDDAVLLGYRLVMESETGEADISAAMTSRLIEVVGKSTPGATNAFSMPPYAIGLAGRISGATENFELARKAGETVLSSPRANPHRAFPSRVGLGLMAAQTGDVESVREHYEALITEGFATTQIDSHRILGIMAHALNELGDAAEHFEDALRFTRNAGYRPELAWSLHDYADMLLERDELGDSEKATAMLDEALQISTDLGMRPLMERVLSKRDILKA